MEDFEKITNYLQDRPQKKINEAAERLKREGELTRLKMLADFLAKDIEDRARRLEEGDYTEPPTATKYHIGF